MKIMLKKTIALILMIIISFPVIVQPSYAESNSPTTIFDNHQENYVTQYKLDDSYSNDIVTTPWKEHLDNFVDGGIKMLEYAAGGAAACYIIQGISTYIFPPAAYVGAFCPAIFGMAATGQAAAQMVH